MSTFMAKQQRDGTVVGPKGAMPPRWFVIDGTDKVVGRLAVQIANVLRGKHRPEYTPHIDTGEFVIVVNAGKVRLTGKKRDTKTYSHYTRYPGGLKTVTARDVLEGKFPERVLLEAVKRMVPRNRLGRQQMTKLKLYSGSTHPHQAQMPVELKLDL